MIYLEFLEKQEQTKSKATSWDEILKVMAESNGMEIKKECKSRESSSFVKVNKVDKLSVKLTERGDQRNKPRDERGVSDVLMRCRKLLAYALKTHIPLTRNPKEVNE
jgi:hypothetical protein